MFEYEWNTHLLSADPSSDHHRQFYDPFSDPIHLLPPNPTQFPTFQPPHLTNPLHHYDPAHLLTPDPTHFVMSPKPEPEFATRIGLNLGGRTYFSSAESEFVNRLYRRSRPESGSGGNVVARCQAEGCYADLTHAKHYHRRHKVCEFHSKAAAVVVAAAGVTQRFCQQCSRFHMLMEFDNGKRSCRKRLADHNRRRRKSNNQTNTNQEQQQQQNQQTPNSHSDNALVDSPSDNLTRSSQDSGTQSTSSVTVAISPQRFSLDSFRQRSYQAAATSSPPTGSLFFSNG